MVSSRILSLTPGQDSTQLSTVTSNLSSGYSTTTQDDNYVEVVRLGDKNVTGECLSSCSL